MITKHTHGPWSVAHRAKGLAINGPRSQVAVIGFLDDQATADAALIAAAPELLAALQAIVESLVEQDDEGLIEHAETMRNARAAIAKATGSTP